MMRQRTRAILPKCPGHVISSYVNDDAPLRSQSLQHHCGIARIACMVYEEYCHGFCRLLSGLIDLGMPVGLVGSLHPYG